MLFDFAVLSGSSCWRRGQHRQGTNGEENRLRSKLREPHPTRSLMRCTVHEPDGIETKGEEEKKADFNPLELLQASLTGESGSCWVKNRFFFLLVIKQS